MLLQLRNFCLIPYHKDFLWIHFISVLCLIALARISNTMLMAVVKGPYLLPDMRRGGGFLSFTITSDVSCGFFINSLFLFGDLLFSFISRFLSVFIIKGVLFCQMFFCIKRDHHVVSFLHCTKVCFINWFSCLEPQGF